MRTGLERWIAEAAGAYRDARIGLACNHTAVDASLRHALPLCTAAGAPVRRLFAPEHGIDATAQDMIGVDDEQRTTEVVSLYTDSEESLRPDPATLSDLDVLLFDIQDVGARYYTYQATLGYIMEVAATTGTKVIVLDRPNPINGVDVEGNQLQPGHASFVGAYPLAVRHGMTMGEMGRLFRDHVGIDVDLEVVECEGWRRDQWFDETGLPWVYPSPNMPTLETAVIYPGLCLIEGTNLSEGRGTTRPFHLVGAPWLDADKMADYCAKGAADAGLRGVAFRPAHFLPQFQKHAGAECSGIEIFVHDRNALESFTLGLVVIEAALRLNPDRFRWRTETYEFVDEPIAIDLLTGSAEARVGLESRVRPLELVEAWKPELAAWEEIRREYLLY